MMDVCSMLVCSMCTAVKIAGSTGTIDARLRPMSKSFIGCVLEVTKEERPLPRRTSKRAPFGFCGIPKVFTLRKFSVFNRAYKIGRIELPCSACAAAPQSSLPVRGCRRLVPG